MYFNTIVTNLTKDVQGIPVGVSTTRIQPGDSMTLPYEVLSACRNPVQKRMLINAIEEGLLGIEYKTDMPVNGKGVKAAPKVEEPEVEEPKVEEPKAEEPKVDQEEVLTDKAKDALQAADEGSGIIEDVTAEELLPKAVTLGEDGPAAKPQDVNLEDMMEGKEQPAEPTKEDVVKEIDTAAKKQAPKKRKPAAKKKAPAKKKNVVQMD